MMAIRIKRRISAAMAVLVGGAVMCGTLAMTATWDTANAQDPCGKPSIIDRILSFGGQGPCRGLSQQEINQKLRKSDQDRQRRNNQAELARLQKQAAERAAAERVARGIGSQPRPLRAERSGQGRGHNAGSQRDSHTARAGRHAGSRPPVRAYARDRTAVRYPSTHMRVLGRAHASSGGHRGRR
jgi:hypothetical protein